MRLPLVVATLLCTLLVALDFAVRALRIHLFLRGAGRPVRYWEVFVLNAFGDAASAATPLRIGGEPARLAGLAHAGVPVALAVPLLAVEVASYLAVVAVAAALTGWLLLPEWWAAAAPRVSVGLPWVAVVLALCLAAWALGRRMRRAAGPARPPGAGTLRALRQALGWPLAASVPLTLVSVAARLAILPVVAATLAAPPPVGDALVSSFLLIYGQLFVPTPGGVGPVELAFASGAAGELGGAFWLWRAFVTGAPLLLGFGLGIPHYGAAAVRAVLRGRAPAPAPDTPG